MTRNKQLIEPNLLKVRSLTHSSNVLSAILTMPVRMEMRENSTGEKISIFSLNIFWMLDARLVLSCDVVASDHPDDLPPKWDLE